MSLALFDLDHTLLSGDSDVLWCEFLIRHGLLSATQRQRNLELDAEYRAGTLSVAAYCSFHVGLLAGRSAAFWAPWCQRFLHEEVLPRIPPAAHALVEGHRAAGHMLVLTTATNRVISELTAQALGIPHLIATEAEVVDGLYSGRVRGLPNMQHGKVERLVDWLAQQGLGTAVLAQAHFYSDSANDLPLLGAVAHPVAVDPDPRLLAHALAQGWPVLQLACPWRGQVPVA